jgi:hypothetical protein
MCFADVLREVAHGATSTTPRMGQGTLVLDIDHTLVHTLSHPVEGWEDVLVLNNGFAHVRPHVILFLRYVLSERSPFAHVGIWTAGTRDYALDVVDELYDHLDDDSRDFDFIFDRSHALRGEDGTFFKHLDFVTKHTGCSDVLLLDDSRVHCLVPGNESRVAIVPDFVADRADAMNDDFFEALLQLTKDAFEEEGCGDDGDGIAVRERATVERGVPPEPSTTYVVTA